MPRLNSVSMLQSRVPRSPLVSSGEIDHHIADLTATASADVTLANFQSHLARENQWLPIDGDPLQTLRELIDENSTGPLRLGCGGWRDLLLGLQLRNWKNDLITVGGRTMKNVAGYDLTKLLIGAHGAFGKIETITIRLLRRPLAALRWQISATAASVFNAIASPLRPNWMLLRDGELHAGKFGSPRDLDFIASQLPSISGTNSRQVSLEDDIAFRAARWLPIRSGKLFRASLPPKHIFDFCDRLGGTNFAADPAFGVAVGAADAIDHIEIAARECGGRLILGGNPHRSASLQKINDALQTGLRG